MLKHSHRAPLIPTEYRSIFMHYASPLFLFRSSSALFRRKLWKLLRTSNETNNDTAAPLARRAQLSASVSVVTYQTENVFDSSDSDDEAMRKQHELVDGDVVVKTSTGFSVRCHRVVLAARIPCISDIFYVFFCFVLFLFVSFYDFLDFKARFESNFKDASDDEIVLDDISDETLRCVITFAYTDVCRVSAEAVVDLLVCSKRLAMTDLEQWTTFVLRNNFDVDNGIVFSIFF